MREKLHPHDKCQRYVLLVEEQRIIWGSHLDIWCHLEFDLQAVTLEDRQIMTGERWLSRAQRPFNRLESSEQMQLRSHSMLDQS